MTTELVPITLCGSEHQVPSLIADEWKKRPTAEVASIQVTTEQMLLQLLVHGFFNTGLKPVLSCHMEPIALYRGPTLLFWLYLQVGSNYVQLGPMVDDQDSCWKVDWCNTIGSFVKKTVYKDLKMMIDDLLANN